MNNELDALDRDVDDANGCIPICALTTVELIKTVVAYVNTDMRCHGIIGVVAASEVKGIRQECECELFDHEIVDQRNYWEDDFHGTIYLPMGDDEYLAVDYASH